MRLKLASCEASTALQAKPQEKFRRS